MIESEGLAAWLRLTLIPGIGGETQRKLLAAFGLPEAVFAAGRLAARALWAAGLICFLILTPLKPSTAAWPGPMNRANPS